MILINIQRKDESWPRFISDVMAGLVPAIHGLLQSRNPKEDVDGRDERGHNVERLCH